MRHKRKIEVCERENSVRILCKFEGDKNTSELKGLVGVFLISLYSSNINGNCSVPPVEYALGPNHIYCVFLLRVCLFLSLRFHCGWDLIFPYTISVMEFTRNYFLGAPNFEKLCGDQIHQPKGLNVVHLYN